MIVLGCIIQIAITVAAGSIAALSGASHIRIFAAAVGAWSAYLGCMGLIVLVNTLRLLKSANPSERRELIMLMSTSSPSQAIVRNTRKNMIFGISGIGWAATLWYLEPGVWVAVAAWLGWLVFAYVVFFATLLAFDQISA